MSPKVEDLSWSINHESACNLILIKICATVKHFKRVRCFCLASTSRPVVVSFFSASPPRSGAGILIIVLRILYVEKRKKTTNEKFLVREQYIPGRLYFSRVPHSRLTVPRRHSSVALSSLSFKRSREKRRLKRIRKIQQRALHPQRAEIFRLGRVRASIDRSSQRDYSIRDKKM